MAAVENGSEGVDGSYTEELDLIRGGDMDACFTAFDKDG